MKNIAAILLFFFSATTMLTAQNTYTPTDAGSNVSFTIKNFGFKTGGNFKGLKGSIHFNPSNIKEADFAVTVDASTINTDNGTRDGHLKKEEYFNVASFPTLSFKSTKIAESTVAGRFVMFGNLTIKGITKAVQFGFSATPKDGGYLFEGSFEINRLDFKVGSSSMSLQDNLKINLSVLGKK